MIRNLKEEKNRLREVFKEIRRNYTPQQKQERDEAIFQRILTLYQYRKTRTLLTYVSKSLETDTLRLIRQALQDGKQVAVPRCVDGTTRMEFYYITNMDQLEKSSFGVLEPIPSRCRPFTGNGEKTLCVVPGMSFDSHGYRLGYGKGYYDRFLANYAGVTVGICYSDCMRWNLPKGRYDKPVDLLVTDRFFRKIKTPESKEVFL